MGQRILVVEDEFIIAEVMMDTLASVGLDQCRHASSLSEALAATGENAWSGALLDIRLNGELVFPVARALKAQGVPFAFCSGDGDCSDIPVELADAPILSKPWAAGALEQLAGRMWGAG